MPCDDDGPFVAAGSRKKITTLEGIQRRGIELDALTGGTNRRVQQPNLASMRSKIMPTHEKFQPHAYLGTVHWVGFLIHLH